MSAIAEPWGKRDRQSGDTHHLAHHCADVAACLLALAGLPALRARLDRAAGRSIDEADLDRLGVLVFLHDIGKLFPGFQAKGWPEGMWKEPVTGHVQEGFDLFINIGDGPAAKALHIERLNEWGVERSLLLAVLAHHGRPLKISQGDRTQMARQKWRRVGEYDPDRAAATIGAVLPAWFPEAFTPCENRLPNGALFEHFLAGLTALADWIGSDSERFKFAAALDLNYMAKAREHAATAIRAFGLDASRQRAARDRSATFLEVSNYATPNAHQRMAAETPLDARLVILEAETGSGKTEAALWRYARLFEAGFVDGLYFAVPTRAAAVQLHGRITAASQRLFGKADPQPILAVPGYMRAGAAEGTPLPDWKVRWDDDGGTDEAKLLARWAAEHSKRYLAAQIAVGTVDQAMLGALMVKHAHMRATSLSRSLLVIDEVHASDRFMTEVQRRLLDAHVAVGGYAMLMSATLGSVARAAWLDQPQPDFAAATEEPYPAVWSKGDPAPRASAVADGREKRVCMETLAAMAPDAAAKRALDAARQGARVLVVRNTVRRAVDTQKALEAAAGPAYGDLLFKVGDAPTLHHSRFAPDDRKKLDKAVEAALETDKARTPGGKVVIGTQTLEQSLDIDADLLITDLCPVDVLLQRIGRLHRHDLPRPVGYEAPRCVVMVPEDGLEPLLRPSFNNGLGAWRDRDGTYQGVYRDLAILELTRRLVGAHALWIISAMNRFLVESATHPERIEALHEELADAWRAYHHKIVAAELAQGQIGRLYAVDRSKRFDAVQFPDLEECIRTRLGAEGARFAFAVPLPKGPFGGEITEVVVPGYWRAQVVDGSPIVLSQSEDSVTFSIGDASFAYDRHGLRRMGKNGDEPSDGASDPL